MQRTDFPVEILIGEDESTDGTREICQRLVAEHPDRIRLLLHKRSDVIHIMGRPTGRANLLHLLNEAKGKYIALCEGDDYWTDPLKLQKQVDALERTPEAVACFTNAWNEQGSERTEYLDGIYTKKPGTRVEQRELVDGQGLPTCTFVCRTDALFPLPPQLHKAPSGDTLLYAHVSNLGHFIHLHEYTAVRRMHAGGLHSLKSRMVKHAIVLRNLPLLDEVSHFRHHEVIESRQLRVASSTWAMCLAEPNKDLARLSWRILARRRKDAGWNFATTARNYLKAFWPRTERLLGRAWDRLKGRSQNLKPS